MKKPLLGLSALSILAACSQGNVDVAKGLEKVTTKTAKSSEFNYISIDKYSPDMAQFVGLQQGESFALSEPKIKAVFKAYDGNITPSNIDMQTEIVEAGWHQVLVTQDGVTDGILAGQQLLAIFDNEKNLVTYGMRIKCQSGATAAQWQNTPC